MAIKFEKNEPGMTLADVHSQRMGNTTMSRLGLWYVRIVSVDRERRGAMVRWNGNPAEWWHARQLEKLYREDRLPKAYWDQEDRGRW